MCNYLVHPPWNCTRGTRTPRRERILNLFLRFCTYTDIFANVTHKAHKNTKKQMFCFAANKRACLHNNNNINNKFGTSHRGPSIGKFSLKNKNKKTKPTLAGSPPCPALFGSKKFQLFQPTQPNNIKGPWLALWHCQAGKFNNSRRREQLWCNTLSRTHTSKQPLVQTLFLRKMRASPSWICVRALTHACSVW